MPGTAPYLFVNPHAGRGRGGRHTTDIVARLRAQGCEPIVHTSSRPGETEASIAALAPGAHEAVIVAGGDGSVHEAVNGLLRAGSAASLGVIPVGTGNDFAKAVGVPLDWRSAAADLAARLASGAPARPIDAGRCNDRYFANGAGVGFDAVVTRLAAAYTAPIGDLVYLLAILRALRDGVATPAMRIVAEDEIWNGPVTLANVANGPFVGGRFHIAPQADPADGLLDLVIAGPVSRGRVIALLPALLRGRHRAAPEVHDYRVAGLRIESEEPVASHLDGEVQPLAAVFDIEILPSALRLA